MHLVALLCRLCYLVFFVDWAGAAKDEERWAREAAKKDLFMACMAVFGAVEEGMRGKTRVGLSFRMPLVLVCLRVAVEAILRTKARQVCVCVCVCVCL